MKSDGELFNEALNKHFGTQHPSNQWDRLGPERQQRFEYAAKKFHDLQEENRREHVELYCS